MAKHDEIGENSRAARIRRLREAMQGETGKPLTQGDLAARSGGLLSQGYLSHLETGRRQARGPEAITGLARAFGLGVAEMMQYLDNNLSLPEALALTTPYRPPSAPDTMPFVQALFDSMSSDFAPSDFDNVRAIIHTTAAVIDPEQTDLLATARAWLVAARDLRQAGHAHTPLHILARASAHPKAVPAPERASTKRVNSNVARLDAERRA